MVDAWSKIEEEARDAFRSFPLRAYSELMPPPYVGFKPYAPARAHRACTNGAGDGNAVDVDEYEQAHDLEPGFDRIAQHLVDELGKLTRGEAHALSHTLLDGNPAWPAELAEAAAAGKLAHDKLVVIAPVALSRSQDDKGMARWTLFGASHEGAAKPFWHGLTEDALGDLLAWARLDGEWRILAHGDLPEALRGRELGRTPLDEIETLVTFLPFAKLPETVRAAYLAGDLALVPSPASLIFYEHRRYAQLERELPRASQIALLHLFPRIEGSCAIRIPQSGWLDEDPPEQRSHKHKVVQTITRTHRWQRIARDAGITEGDGAYTDKVSVALFSTEPVDIELYAKPLARNSQLWTEDYHLLLDGPNATTEAIMKAAKAVDVGGRFGYRMYYPPMRAGVREMFWHVPVVACAKRGRFVEAGNGYLTAERADRESILFEVNLLDRPSHVAAARDFEKDPGLARYTTSNNVRKLLEAHELLGGKLDEAHARALLHISKHDTLSDWLANLPSHARDRHAAKDIAGELRELFVSGGEPGPALVLDGLGTRAFEEAVWNSIASLAHGEFRQKNDADGITVNKGKHGGPAAKAAHIVTNEKNDLEALGDHLHARYRALGVESFDHRFKWQSDFAFEWMGGWAKNQETPSERNIVAVIPGKRHDQAVVMGDHYDTAYMEDVYYPEKGGDLLRAPACGADDNHSATTALLLAAEHLIGLSRAGKLERDVWLIHLTGEEYPGDCMGARALCQALVEKNLVLRDPTSGATRDVSRVDVVGAFILDMIGHNTERDRDVFQIAPGEGAGSARLARHAHVANMKWNRAAARWNAESRAELTRAERVPEGMSPPPPFAHLPLHGEIRVEWEPRSALYNTDGQIFSDVGIPVVLFMENYDISRTGYHDTHDTLANIDLDYCAAVTAIAIETVAATACAVEP